MRESGFYWVHRNGEWVVARWDSPMRYWYIAGVGYGFAKDNLIDEIDERRIERTEP